MRSDVYSLGVTLWFMLAGKPPFTGSVVQVMSQHLHRQPPFRELGEQPESLLSLLRRMLAKDPANRPQSAGALRREIEEALEKAAGGRQQAAGGDAVRRTPTAPVAPTNERATPMGPPEARPHSTRSSAWRGMVTTLLLVVGFVVIAATFALVAWYLLGPGDALPSTRKPPDKGKPGKSFNSAPARPGAAGETPTISESSRCWVNSEKWYENRFTLPGQSIRA